MKEKISQLREFIDSATDKYIENDKIDQQLFNELNVKRGLRDKNGVGVLAGLTTVSSIVSSKIVDGENVPCDGELSFRGYNINDLVNGASKENRFGFEEASYLLLFGELPTKEELSEFTELDRKSVV